VRRAGPAQRATREQVATPVIARGEALRRDERLDLAHDRADGNRCSVAGTEPEALGNFRMLRWDLLAQRPPSRHMLRARGTWGE